MTTEPKKGAARGAKADPRAAGPRSVERTGASKRPSTPPVALAVTQSSAPANAKKRERPSHDVENDDDEHEELAQQPARKPVGAGFGGLGAGGHGAGSHGPGAHGAHGPGAHVPGGPRRGLPTGSLHTEAREPAQAQALKQRLTALMTAQQRLGELKRSAHKRFYEVGEVLRKVRDERLFEVKGYSSIDAFVEREVQLGAQFCRDAVRIHELFLPEAAQLFGMSRLSAALRALEDEPSGVTALDQIPGARPAIPPHKL